MIAASTSLLTKLARQEKQKRLTGRPQRTSLTSPDAIRSFLRDQSGDLVEMAAIHLSWHRHIEVCWDHGLNPLILAPMSHGKTVQLVVGKVCDFIGRAELKRQQEGKAPVFGRNSRIKIVCNDEQSAAERMRVIGETLLSPEYQKLYPAIQKSTKLPWNSDVLNVQRDPGVNLVDSTVTGKGILSTGIGGRAELLVFDDVVDLRNCIAEPANRKKINDGFGATWMSRREPWGKALVVGTRWHPNDLYGQLKETKGWVTLEQAISDDFRAITCRVYGWPEGIGPYPDFADLH